jgi:MFS family permease
MGTLSNPTKTQSKNAQNYYPWLIVLGCCCMQIGGIGIFLDSCGVFYVPASEGLGISVGTYSQYLSFSFLGTIPAALAASYLINKVDIRLLIGVNVVIGSLMLMLMGYYPAMWMRNIAGFIVGFSGGFYFMIMTPVLINNWFIKRKGLAIGIAMASSGVGAAILSPLITLLIAAIGWQLSYVCTGLLVMLLILPWDIGVFHLKPEDIGLKPFGWEEADALEETSKNLDRSGIPYARAIKTLSFLCVCLFVGSIAMFSGYNSYLNAFGQSLGYTALVSSTFLVAVSLGSIFEKLLMGFLYDYIGIYKIIWINCALLVTGLFILGTQSNLTLLYIGAALFGIQNSLVAVQTPLLIRELFGNRDYSRLIPLTRIGIGALGMMGPILVANIYNATGTYSVVWLTSSAIVVVAVCFVIIARVGKKRYAKFWKQEEQEKDI